MFNASLSKLLIMAIILQIMIFFTYLPADSAPDPASTTAQGLVGDIPDEISASAYNTGTSKPADGDRIIFGTIGEASNLISYLSTDSASHEVADLLFVAPLRYNSELEPEAWAAETWEMSKDGKLIRFKLHKNILWEDGVELTAQDVEFTYKTVIAPTTGSPYAEDFSRVKEFRIIDKYSFEVEYDEFFARAVSSWMSPILPKHILEGQNIRNTSFSRKPIGAGPYRLKNWESGSRIVLEASPTYFEGKPHITEVVYRIIPDDSTMFMETRAGRLDVMNLNPLQYLRQTNGAYWEEEYHKYRYLASVYIFMGFNLQHPFFNDVNVRRAISMAINREDLVTGALLGQGVAAFGPYKPGSWVYHPALSPIKQDINQAEKLLKESGFTKNKDGILQKDGKLFEFTILTNQGNEQRILTSTLIQSQLAPLGIIAKTRTVEWAAFIREFVHKGRFDAVILGWTITQDPDIFQIWHSSQAHDGGLNFTRYSNPEVDKILEEARAIPDRDKRAQLYGKLQEILARDQPYCFLFVPYALPIVQRRFMGIKPALAGIMYNFDKWYVPKVLQRYEITE